MEKYSDKDILVGIRQRKTVILEYLYNEYFPQVLRIVVRHGGDEHDARDLFQEGLIIIFNRLAKDELEIKSSFHNYFIVLCRFLWFRQKNISHDVACDSVEDEQEADQEFWDPVVDSGDSGDSGDRGDSGDSGDSGDRGDSGGAAANPDTSPEAVQEGIGDKEYSEYLNSQSEKIYQRHYRKLPGDCKRVIKMFLKKRAFRDIASRMNYGSEEYGRRKKYLCMQHLMKMINEDPEYIELLRIRRSKQE